MKNTKRNTIVLLIIIAIVLFFIMKDDFNEIIDNLILANKWLILLTVGLVFIYWLLRALSLYLIVKRYKNNIKYSKMFNQILITQFFNGITPFATGGEPMQVYMLTKSGIRVANATNIIVQEFIMYQIALVLIGVLALGLNFAFDVCILNPVLENLIIIGFIINIIIGLFLLFVSFSKRFSSFVVRVGLKFGFKLKFIKNIEKSRESWNEKLKDYHESGDMLKKNRILFITCVIINFVALLMFYIIPYFIFISLGYEVGFMQVLVSSAFILIIGNFVPIPGGSGGIEFGFLEFFKPFCPVGPLKSALIIWRSVTYFLGIILGGCALGFFKGDENI
ncbi:MAG: flippase-like domain-containing protein [Bacilli bacterium]|nr:flippase-like domain-containing protein [Bacilli bacterium]